MITLPLWALNPLRIFRFRVQRLRETTRRPRFPPKILILKCLTGTSGTTRKAVLKAPLEVSIWPRSSIRI